MAFPLAYFDPSAGSLLLQAVVGGLGGIVVVGRFLWMRYLGNRSTSPVMNPPAEAPALARNRLE